MTPQIAVSILSGTIGSNGNDFVDSLLAAAENSNVTAIVPAASGKKKKVTTVAGISKIPTTQRFARYGQGCSCCTVRSDLIVKIKEIVAEDRADHVLVQIPPNGDLDIVGKTFTVANKDGYRLADVAMLERLIVVIDGPRFIENLRSAAGQSLFDRIRVATVIGIENASDLTPEAYQNISETLNSFNPGALLIRDDDTAALQTINFGRATPRIQPMQPSVCSL